MTRHRPAFATLIVVSTLAVASAGAASAAERTEVVRRTIELERGTTRVVIDNVMGSVSVRAGEAGKVTVEITQRATSARQSSLDDAFREVTLEVETESDSIELVQDGPFRCDDRCCSSGKSDCRWDPDYRMNWQWEVTVPPGIDLEASTVNGGALDIAGVSGRVKASNVNGPLRLAGLRGEVVAATVNGDLEAAFERQPPIASSFTTVNGDVELALPADATAELGVETLHGDIYSDFDVTAVPVRAVTERDSGSGRRYRFERNRVVRIGGGGVRLDCKTLNGDIVVRAR